MTSHLRLPPIYPIVDVRETSPAALSRAAMLARAVASAGAWLVQLRAKCLAAGAMTELAARIVGDIAPFGGLLIVNDRADVAVAAGAAGVHLGDEDIPVEAARATLGPDAIVGFSTHSLDELAAVTSAAADYFGFGPVFVSPTKTGVRSPRGVELLSAACSQSSRPLVAIGGITLANAPALWRAGASAVAVISDLERADDPAALVRAYLKIGTVTVFSKTRK